MDLIVNNECTTILEARVNICCIFSIAILLNNSCYCLKKEFPFWSIIFSYFIWTWIWMDKVFLSSAERRHLLELISSRKIREKITTYCYCPFSFEYKQWVSDYFELGLCKSTSNANELAHCYFAFNEHIHTYCAMLQLYGLW